MPVKRAAPADVSGKAPHVHGFTLGDFRAFQVVGFEERMAQIRARVKPKLIEYGTLLAPRLSRMLGERLYPHVAQHLRRRVNPPPETWVAFARSVRAYKPFIHIRLAVRAEGLQVLVFVEDDADDKLLFAANLKRNAALIASMFADHAELTAFDMEGPLGLPLAGANVSTIALQTFADRLLHVKAQHAHFGILYPYGSSKVTSGPAVVKTVLTAVSVMKPLYCLGTAEGMILQ